MSYYLGWCSTHFSGEKLKATAHVSATFGAANEILYAFILKCHIFPLRISIVACVSHSAENESSLTAYTGKRNNT
jgi:hypothetical protein